MLSGGLNMSELAKIEKKLKTHKPYVPVHDDPKAELRRLVQEHRNTTRNSVSLGLMASDRTDRKTGEVMPCRLPKDAKDALLETSEALKRAANRLQRHMEKQLAKLPIWILFLSKVRGCGPVTAAYLVAYIDWAICTKPSQLKRFCGFAVVDGKSERRSKGEKLHYVSELKTRLYQMFAIGIRQNKRHGSSKYMSIWENAKHGLLTTRGPETEFKRTKGWCDDTSRRKATDAFLEDLYIVGRATAGLEVWPTYYERMTCHEHGGSIADITPKVISIEDALRKVGVADVGPAEVIDESELDEDDSAAAE